MSWSLSIQGKKSAVAAKIEAKFDEVTYLTDEAEKAIKESLKAAAVAAVNAHADDQFIVVEASGSCTPGKTQNVSLKISQLYGFVE